MNGWRASEKQRGLERAAEARRAQAVAAPLAASAA
jgi:hypothetical protein